MILLSQTHNFIGYLGTISNTWHFSHSRQFKQKHIYIRLFNLFYVIQCITNISTSGYSSYSRQFNELCTYLQILLIWPLSSNNDVKFVKSRSSDPSRRCWVRGHSMRTWCSSCTRPMAHPHRRWSAGTRLQRPVSTRRLCDINRTRLKVRLW